MDIKLAALCGSECWTLKRVATTQEGEQQWQHTKCSIFIVHKNCQYVIITHNMRISIRWLEGDEKFLCWKDIIQVWWQSAVTLRRHVLQNFSHRVFYNKAHTHCLACHLNANSLIQNFLNRTEYMLMKTQRTHNCWSQW